MLSAIGIIERCKVESGGVYFLLSYVLGSRIAAAVGLLYCFGQVIDLHKYLLSSIISPPMPITLVLLILGCRWGSMSYGICRVNSWFDRSRCTIYTMGPKRISNGRRLYPGVVQYCRRKVGY